MDEIGSLWWKTDTASRVILADDRKRSHIYALYDIRKGIIYCNLAAKGKKP